MDKPTQSENKIIGATYERNRFEVHARYYDRSKKEWGNWSVVSRRAKTIELARADRDSSKESNTFLSQVVDFGHSATEYRIVKVTAQCEVVE